MFAAMLACVVVFAFAGQVRELPSAFFPAMLLAMGGFTVSAAMTALGLLAAYRSGMRVWIGEGVNRARTLLTAMLIVGFALVVFPAIGFCLALLEPPAGYRQAAGLLIMLAVWGCTFGGAVIILLLCDILSRRVVADRPGKFGPKVPTVGKWNI
jgi:hypothetical protein